MSDGYDLSEYLDGFDRGMSAPEAFYTLMAASVVCDGDRDEREEEELRALAKRTATLREYAKANPNPMTELMSKTLNRLSGSGPDLAAKALEVARDACATIRQAKDGASMAYSAYAHAVDIVLADGKVLDLELKFLNTVAQELDLPKSQAGEIITVLRKKNKH